MKIDYIPQFCPRCGKKLMVWDGNTQTPMSVKCKKCNRLAVFYPQYQRVILKDLPSRDQSSGIRFY